MPARWSRTHSSAKILSRKRSSRVPFVSQCTTSLSECAGTGSMFGGAFISCSRAVTWIDGTGYVVCPVDAVNGVRRSFCHPLQTTRRRFQTTTARDASAKSVGYAAAGNDSGEPFARLVNAQQFGDGLAQAVGAVICAEQCDLRHRVAQHGGGDRVPLGMVGIEEAFR